MSTMQFQRRDSPILALLILMVQVGLPSRVAGAEPDGEFAIFVGAKICLTCHGRHGTEDRCFEKSEPKHARAFAKLETTNAEHIAALSGVLGSPTQSRLCLGCHSTGADEGARWMAATFHTEDGVQCEACHGAGGRHVDLFAGGARPDSSDLLYIEEGDPWRCAACHQEKRSHRDVVKNGFALTNEDRLYKTPVDLCVSQDGRQLYVANEHADSVSVVDVESGRVIAEIRVGRRPQSVVLSPDGSTVFVTCRMSDELYVIDVAKLSTSWKTATGRDPHGIALDPAGTHIFVANTGEDTVSVIDVTDRREIKRLATGRSPWALALSSDGSTVYVTSVRPRGGKFRDPPISEVAVIDSARAIVTKSLDIPDAHMMMGIDAVSVREAMIFTLVRAKNLVPLTRLQQGWTMTNGIGVLWEDGRVDQILLDLPNDAFADPMDVAVTPNGKLALVTGGGVDAVSVVDIAKLFAFVRSKSDNVRQHVLPNHLGSAEEFVTRRLPVGANPRGVAVGPNGQYAYCVNALDDSISVIDLAQLSTTRTILLGGPTSRSELRRGERLFHSAAGTFGRQFSCRSCHPDGHIDGLTFDIEADGLGLHPVDNRSLRGIADTMPFKWTGTNASLFDQCGPRLARFFTRRAPFSPDELLALVRYMRTIERTPNRYRKPTGLTVAQRRGKAIFERTVANDGRPIPLTGQCRFCHRGAHRTNEAKFKVGTAMWYDGDINVPSDFRRANEYGELGTYVFIDAGLPGAEFDVPHLQNLMESAPFLHNGAAATLEEIWTRFNMVDRHGQTGDLVRQQLNDLISYLKSL